MRDDEGRPLPPWSGGEAETALGFLEFLRATLEWKTAGLGAAQLAQHHPPSTMTLGGMLKHLAFVEDWWFSHTFLGRSAEEPWAGVDWKVDPDWDWHSAAEQQPDELRALWRAAVDRSRSVTAASELDALAASPLRNGERVSLRWIVLHMIEEYARHCGHADLLREAVDGLTGE
ncbi:MAG TPA: DinB family protein [Nocardioidaceae bacterium]|nr:DinB family protein [Nocardioidaceae bacterium]